jgi:Tol biopolymer transport system component
VTGEIGIVGDGETAAGAPAMDHSGRYVLLETAGTPGRLLRIDTLSGASVDAAETPSFLAIETSLSGDGNRVAYMSRPAGAPSHQLFVRDIAQSLTLAVRTPSGEFANGPLFRPGLDLDGSVVVFESQAANLNGTSRSQILRHDFASGQTAIASRAANGDPADSFIIDTPTVSDDGTTIAFRAYAFNYPGIDQSEEYFPQAYVVRVGGPPVLVSTNASGVPATSIETCEGPGLPLPCSGVRSLSPSLSGDASTLAFHSFSTNLSSEDSSPDEPDVYVARVPPGIATQPVPVPTLSHWWLMAACLGAVTVVRNLLERRSRRLR